MSFADLLAEDRRLVILRALDEAPGYELNEMVARTVLDHFGHRVGRDVLRADFAWLGEQRLLTVERVAAQTGELWIARLSHAGQEVAQGRIFPGIARREPG